MHFSQTVVASVAHIDAPDAVSSAELEERFEETLTRIGSRIGLIELLTGIRQRRFWPLEVMPSTVAAQAGALALTKAAVPAEKIGVLVNTSVCKDFIEPSVASTVHGILGLKPDCINFDIGNACLAFLDGMTVVANMIDRGQVDYGLIVDGENARFAVESTIQRLARPDTTEQDLRDNFATLTLGSGAAAMVLARKDLADGHSFVGGVRRAATEFNHLCRGQADQMITDAKQLLDAGVELADATFEKARRELDWSAEHLDLLVMHQVGSAHARTVLSRLGLSADRAFFTYPTFGNIGPAAIPITLSKAIEAGRIFPGDRVALMGIGSGLNCAMMEVRF